MIGAALDAASWAMLVTGAILAAAGAIGVLRMPDFYTRMHAASITDTGGMILIIAGLALQAPGPLVAAKLVLIASFLLFTNPTATHALAHAALTDGLEPRLAHDGDETH